MSPAKANKDNTERARLDAHLAAYDQFRTEVMAALQLHQQSIEALYQALRITMPQDDGTQRVLPVATVEVEHRFTNVYASRWIGQQRAIGHTQNGNLDPDDEGWRVGHAEVLRLVLPEPLQLSQDEIVPEGTPAVVFLDGEDMVWLVGDDTKSWFVPEDASVLRRGLARG